MATKVAFERLKPMVLIHQKRDNKTIKGIINYLTAHNVNGNIIGQILSLPGYFFGPGFL
jgi:hypothetical protein